MCQLTKGAEPGRLTPWPGPSLTACRHHDGIDGKNVQKGPTRPLAGRCWRDPIGSEADRSGASAELGEIAIGKQRDCQLTASESVCLRACVTSAVSWRRGVGMPEPGNAARHPPEQWPWTSLPVPGAVVRRPSTPPWRVLSDLEERVALGVLRHLGGPAGKSSAGG